MILLSCNTLWLLQSGMMILKKALKQSPHHSLKTRKTIFRDAEYLYAYEFLTSLFWPVKPVAESASINHFDHVTEQNLPVHELRVLQNQANQLQLIILTTQQNRIYLFMSCMYCRIKPISWLRALTDPVLSSLRPLLVSFRTASLSPALTCSGPVVGRLIVEMRRLSSWSTQETHPRPSKLSRRSKACLKKRYFSKHA